MVLSLFSTQNGGNRLFVVRLIFTTVAQRGWFAPDTLPNFGALLIFQYVDLVK